jgi:hypothetical protein
MQFAYRPAPICANFAFSFPKKVVKDQRWPTDPLFVVNISSPFGEFTVPLRHIVPIHNVTANSSNLFVNSRWTLLFCIEKRYDRKWWDFGSALPF